MVPPSQVLSTAINLAKEIASNSPDAVWSTKKALLDGQQYASLEEAVIKHNLSEESKRVYQGDNIREGLLAFSEVRLLLGYLFSAISCRMSRGANQHG